MTTCRSGATRDDITVHSHSEEPVVVDRAWRLQGLAFRAADVFVGMIRGNPHLQVVLSLRPPPDPEEAATRVAAQVQILLNGVRTRR